MYEPGWLSFYAAALEIEQRFRLSRAEARKKLRKACADQQIDTMKVPCEEPGPLPFEFWTRIAPGEWSEREADYDGPDADGCTTEVMVFEKDFQYWLGQHSQQQEKKQTRGKVPLIIKHLQEMFPESVPDPAICPRKVLKDDLIKKDKKLVTLDDATLKRAIDQYNHDRKQSEVIRNRGVSD
jgi:hypothetical protein